MTDLRCSTVARQEGLDPLGTAGHYRGFLLVEWPLPWPSDLGEVEALGPLVEALAGTGVRLQGLVPARGHERRVVFYRQPPGRDAFAGYERVERRTGPDGDAVVAEAVDLLSAGPDTPTGPTDATDPAGPPGSVAGSVGLVAGSPGAVAGTAEAANLASTVGGDLLICTHGRRDACCGKQGTALVMEVATDPDIAAAGYRVSRTSHTGGHRFAPTAIVLPEGTIWAYLDAELVARLVLRQGEAADVLGHYRGSTGVGSPALQAIERAAFAEIGWDWLGWRRWGEDLGDGRVRVVGEAPDGSRCAWEASVTDRSKPVPVCGQPIAAAVKQQREPVVVSLERTPS
jgi:hypothetical protein